MRRIACALVLVGLTSAALTMGWFAFECFSVCSDCGKIRNTVCHRFPMTRITYYERHEYEETDVSRTLKETGLVGEHEHRWVFGWGSGNGVRCAIGRGTNIDFRAVEADPTGLLRSLARFGDEETKAFWLRVLLDPSISVPEREFAILAAPGGGSGTREEFVAGLRSWSAIGWHTFLRRYGLPAPPWENAEEYWQRGPSFPGGEGRRDSERERAAEAPGRSRGGARETAGGDIEP
jgi:hypothetical protein